MAIELALAQMRAAAGMVAALDQSGGSTPGTLKAYGYGADAYGTEQEMFDLVHAMRVRIMTAPAFVGDKVIGTILFEATMDGAIAGRPVPEFLWGERRVVPFLKIDKGLLPESEGVSLMKPMPELGALLDRAARLGIFGTKMRSTIRLASNAGIEAIVNQQFDVAKLVGEHGLIPIIEPEVLVASPERAAAERLLLEHLRARLEGLAPGEQVLLKLTIPEVPDLYRPLAEHPRVVRLLALSGGFEREEACQRLARNHGMIASFSRALLEGLRHDMADSAFDERLSSIIDAIYQASVLKD